MFLVGTDVSRITTTLLLGKNTHPLSSAIHPSEVHTTHGFPGLSEENVEISHGYNPNSNDTHVCFFYS